MSPRRPPRSLLGLARKIDYLRKTLTGRSSAARHLSTLRAFLLARPSMSPPPTGMYARLSRANAPPGGGRAFLLSSRSPASPLSGLARKIDYLRKALAAAASPALAASCLPAVGVSSQNRLSPPADALPGDLSPLCGRSSPPVCLLAK